jgi:DNA-binding MarR family transcriptional regulator
MEIEGTTHSNPTMLERVLRWHGEFRRGLEPIGVTPPQARVILYLYRHPDAKLQAAAGALGALSPTLAVVIHDLIRNRWATKRRALHDDRPLCLRLNRQSVMLTMKIEHQAGIDQVANKESQEINANSVTPARQNDWIIQFREELPEEEPSFSSLTTICNYEQIWEDRPTRRKHLVIRFF